MHHNFVMHRTTPNDHSSLAFQRLLGRCTDGICLGGFPLLSVKRSVTLRHLVQGLHPSVCAYRFIEMFVPTLTWDFVM